MRTLSYHIIINAPKNKIWETLWNPETYAEWRQFLMPNSKLETDWKAGGITRFWDSPGNGKRSTITHIEVPDVVTFNHLGLISKGIEDTQTCKIKEWSGAPERYLLIPLSDGSIRLQAEVRDFANEQEKLDEGFKKGFEIVKRLAEGTSV